jgi:hypothetical protein
MGHDEIELTMHKSARFGLLLILLLAQGCAAPPETGPPDAGSSTCDGAAHCAWECPEGTAVDQCGECGGENRSKDCRGVCYGGASVDECGICGQEPYPDCEPPQTLAPSQSGQDDHFGETVSLNGERALIGAVHDDAGGENSGAAYVFLRDPEGWILQQKLTTDDATAGDNFGYAVAIDGDTALVGAYADDEHGENRGSAYFFELENGEWKQQVELAPPTQAGELYYFGIAVALDNDTALIGVRRYYTASAAGRPECYSGSVFVYVRDPTGWSLQDELWNEDSTDCDRFGEKVAVEGDTAVVGAPGYWEASEVASTAPSVYVFTRSDDAWSEQAGLRAAERIVGVKFGASVSISRDTVMVGAPFAEQTDGRTGSAYVYTRGDSGWNRQGHLLASDPAAGSFFGLSVDLAGDIAVVGAPFGNPGQGVRSGAAYVFVREGTEWVEKAKIMDLVRPAFDWYGWNVAVSNDSVLVGAEPSGTARVHPLPSSLVGNANLAP